MKKPSILLSLLVLASCGQQVQSSKIKRTKLQEGSEVRVIIAGVADVKEFKNKAMAGGIRVEGDSILVLEGDASAINALEIPANENFNYLLDEPITLNRPAGFTPDKDALFLAKKDFGIFDLWKSHPEADGRGVIVGVMDDGISPHQDGFKITSTGERKFIGKNSQSTFTTFDLVETADGFEAVIDETRNAITGQVDLDKNGVLETYAIKVNKSLDQACWNNQCKGSFAKTGEFFLAKDPRYAIMIEIDETAKKLKVLQPEAGDDSHGEGVASVLAGHRIGNLPGFDGVAPGSKILDYDLSELTDKADEQEYTIATFLKGLDWLGANGAEVANISYSLFFSSTETQAFMRNALADIINKHNIVISFSAGNNGPGLGSLNRRSIYPESSLVAGAFVSKELDEKVHGVTGIPEEGRVIYYSSRGPGQGTGPTLISPLSSLTNSTPDLGHRAFNGTSSASPALAGAATILISAIKQDGLKVHAPSVVHALRLSGKRLKNEAFVSQGNGLPQLKKALEIYKQIINGETFENVLVSVGAESQDKVAAKGFTIRTSQTSGIETRVISLLGLTSSLAPEDKKVNLLIPVRLKYSKGITGPQELWVSSSNSNFSIDVDTETLLGDQAEAFGEVTAISQIDNLPLATIPVTIVKDVDVRTRPSFTMKVAAQEGKRFHINIPEGVKAFRVKSESIDNVHSSVNVAVFDTHQIRIKRAKPGSDLWVQVDRAGHYQIAVSLDRGTPRGAEVFVQVEPIDLQLKTKQAVESDPQFVIVNKTRSPLFGLLKVRKSDEVVASHIIGSDFKTPEFTTRLSMGSYKIAANVTSDYDLSYQYYNCTTRYTDENGKQVLTDAMKLDIKQDTDVSVRCMPFDLGMKASSTYRWLVQVLRTQPAASIRLDMAPLMQRPVKIKDMKKGQYVLEVEDPLNPENIIQVGNLEVI